MTGSKSVNSSDERDTTNAHQIAAHTPGDAVTWWYESRGGWGYVWSVPAYVVKVTAKRVGIAALHRDGETWVPRWVKPEKLEHGHPELRVSM